MTARLRRTTAVTVAAGCTLALAATALGARQLSTPLPSLASMAIAVSDFQSGAADRAAGDRDKRRPAGVHAPLRSGRADRRHALSHRGRRGGASTPTPSRPRATSCSCRTSSAPSRDGARSRRASPRVSPPARRASSRSSKTITSPPVALDAGSLSLAVTIVTNQGRLPIAVDVVQADRALSVIILAGMFGQRIAHGDAARPAAAAEAHIKAAFTVSSSAAPTISGQAQQGQTLSVDEGSWTGAPSSFSYVWARCDSTGTTCTPIDGATDKTYTLTSADSGSTVRVTVTGGQHRQLATGGVGSDRSREPSPTSPSRGRPAGRRVRACGGGGSVSGARGE